MDNKKCYANKIPESDYEKIATISGVYTGYYVSFLDGSVVKVPRFEADKIRAALLEKDTVNVTRKS